MTQREKIILLETIKNIRNRAGTGHSAGYELMRDTVNQIIKIIEEKENNEYTARILLSKTETLDNQTNMQGTLPAQRKTIIPGHYAGAMRSEKRR